MNKFINGYKKMVNWTKNNYRNMLWFMMINLLVLTIMIKIAVVVKKMLN